MTPLKEQIKNHRKNLREFDEYERTIRDFLLLCMPQTVIANHAKAAAEMLSWFEQGQFESQARQYPFPPKLLQTALLKMYEESAFVPESNSNPERPLRYLKKIMVRLIEQQAQSQQAAGVITTPPCPPQGMGTPPCPPQGGNAVKTSPNPLQRGSSENHPLRGEGGCGQEWVAPLTAAWCKHALDGLRNVNGLDVRHLIVRVEDIRDNPELFTDDLPQAIETMLLVEAQEAVGRDGMIQLRKEVSSWFVGHENEWTAETLTQTINAALDERLRERFRLPRLV